MIRASQAFVVTILAIVAGIWVREQGPPLEGADQLWTSQATELRDVTALAVSGTRYAVLETDARPVLLDRRDGSVRRLDAGRVAAVSADGTVVTVDKGKLLAAGKNSWEKAVGPLLDDLDPVLLGSDDGVLAIGGCADGNGVAVGLDLADGSQRWDSPGCAQAPAEPQPSRYFVTTRPAAAFPDGPAVDAFLHEVGTGRQVADFPRVRDVHLVGDDLLVLDSDGQLSAHQGDRTRWLLDPETAALADGPASGIETGFAGTPALVFDEGRALVDPTSGTMRRGRTWQAGPLASGGKDRAVAFGREYAWSGRDLVVRNVFTGRELWREQLPAGSAVADFADQAMVTVTVTRANGRHEAFVLDSLTGDRLLRALPRPEPWSLVPAGDGSVLVGHEDRSYLVAVAAG